MWHVSCCTFVLLLSPFSASCGEMKLIRLAALTQCPLRACLADSSKGGSFPITTPFQCPIVPQAPSAKCLCVCVAGFFLPPLVPHGHAISTAATYLGVSQKGSPGRCRFRFFPFSSVFFRFFPFLSFFSVFFVFFVFFRFFPFHFQKKRGDTVRETPFAKPRLPQGMDTIAYETQGDRRRWSTIQSRRRHRDRNGSPFQSKK